MSSAARKRATAIIVKDGKILLFRRIKPGLDYFSFPGGGIEEGETPEDALKREVDEELSLKVEKARLLFEIPNIQAPSFAVYKMPRHDFSFLVTEYTGTPKLGGPELERTNQGNQYHIVWISLVDVYKADNIFPKEIVVKLKEVLNGK